MSYSVIDASQKLIVQVNELLSDSQDILSDLVGTDEFQESASFDINIKIIQLLLEYRLCGQDALTMVLKLDHNLIALLGIEPKHNAASNLDRLAFALGNEDLKQILYALSKLVDYLLKVIHSYQKNQKPRNRYSCRNKENNTPKLLLRMQHLVMQQKKMCFLLNELGKNIEQLLPIEAVGPLYDHIAAFRGPISHFFQAIQHGIGLAHELYQLANKAVPLNLTLTNVLKQVEEVLQQMPSIYHSQPHYQLPPLSIDTLERLEQRASTKRLSPFFNH